MLLKKMDLFIYFTQLCRFVQLFQASAKGAQSSSAHSWPRLQMSWENVQQHESWHVVAILSWPAHEGNTRSRDKSRVLCMGYHFTRIHIITNFCILSKLRNIGNPSSSQLSKAIVQVKALNSFLDTGKCSRAAFCHTVSKSTLRRCEDRPLFSAGCTRHQSCERSA